MKRNFFLVGVLSVVLAGVGSVWAVSPITSIQAHFDNVDDDSQDFTAAGAGTGAFPAGTTYQTTFTRGDFDNLIIDAFDVGTNNFIFRQLAQQIRIVRVDNASVTGAHHILLYDQEGAIQNTTNIPLSSQYVGTMEEILLADVINRGVDNVFCNTGNGDGNNNNIERIDYLFGDGYPAFGSLRKKGFMVMDRGGNDALWIAAILALDTNGNPAAYSDPILLATTGWGNSGITLDTIVYRGYDENFRPSADVGSQQLTGQYVEWEEFGIASNTLVFGYSLVAADVPATQNWLNVAAFPLATTEGSTAGGLDLMSGGALVLDERQNATLGDFVWNDLNQNGLQDAGEPGVTNVLVRIYDGTGTNLAGQARTDSNGGYFIYALEPNLSYQIEVLAPTNYVFTLLDQGPNDNVDSDVETNTGRSGFFPLFSGTTNQSLDAGMYLPPTDLGVGKRVSDNTPRVGTNITFTLTVTNFGPYTADLLILRDVLPAGLTYSNSLATVGSYDSLSGDWTILNMPSNSTATLVITAGVDQASAGWAITNTTYFTFVDRPDTNTLNNTSSVSMLIRSVDLGMGKRISTNLIGVTNLITYTVSITNFGPDTALSVVVTDSIPSGLLFTSATVSVGSYVTNTGLWAVGDLANGQTATLIITARVDAASGGLMLTNTATALTAGLGDTNAANDSASVLLNVVGADLGVTKTPDNPGPYPGSNVVYTIVLTNQGPSEATGISLTERLTNGLTYVTHSTTYGIYDNVSGVWTVGTLAAYGSAYLYITATVYTGTINSLITNNTAITTADIADGNTANNTGTAVIAVSSLRMSKSSSAAGSALPGSNITYTIIITNAGSLVHTNITVTDALPTGTTYVASSARARGPIVSTNYVLDRFETFAFTNQNGNVNWNGNWIEIGEGDGANSGDVRGTTDGTNRVLRIQDNDSGGEGVRRQVNLDSVEAATLSFAFRRAVLSASSDYVAIYASSNGGSSFTELGRFAGPSTDASYVFTNYDISAYIATNTQVRLLGSSGLGGGEYVYFDNIQVSWMVGGTNTISGNPPPDLTSGWTLKAGEILTVTYTSRVDNPVSVTQIVNTAYATSLSQLLPISASVTDTVAATDLAVSKSVDNTLPASGSNVIYTITITNRGPQDAASVTLSEPLAAGLLFITNLASRGTYTTNTGVWTLGALTNGTAATLTITARVATNTAYIGTSITNTISINGSSLADMVPTNNAASAVITVSAAELGLTKAVNDTTPLLGDTVVFTLGLTNSGPNEAESIAVTEVWPGPVSHLSNTPSQGSYNPASGLWSVGTLAAGGYATLTINASVTTTVVGISFTNRASISASSQPDPVTGNNTASVVLVTGSSDPLSITKSSSANGSAPPGETNTYTIVITNSTAFTHTGVRVEDAVPTGMTYVASSTLVTAPLVTERYWEDNFRSRVYNNQHGNTNWLTDWDESETDNAQAGSIQILYDPLRGETYSLRFEGAGVANLNIRRNADLGTFTNAAFSFLYRRDSLEAGDFVLAQISSNAFAGPWTTLLRMEGAATDASYAYTNFDITPWISTNVAIRFITTNTSMNTGDFVWMDDVRISSSRKEYLTYEGGLPPVATTNIILFAGDYMTVVMKAVVDSPASVTQVLNTASVTTDQQLVTLYASVTDRVEFADLGLGKSVLDPLPDAGGIQVFTITVTNYGPNDARSIILQDILPAEVSYVGSGATTGTYSSGSSLWTLGTLTLSNAARLAITTTVSSAAAGLTITNYTAVYSVSQGDRNSTNNTAEASFRVVPPFIITSCDYETTNGAVEVYHDIANTQQLYSLLFCDAITFRNTLSNQWQLADQRAGGLLLDTGSVSRTAPANLSAGLLRFYRLSAPGFWEDLQAPRRAGTEVLAFGVSHLQPGENWVRPWGEPCDNTLGEIFEHGLPAGAGLIDSTRVLWFDRNAWQVPMTAEVFHVTGNAWLWVWPESLVGESAESAPLPLHDGFMVQIPTNLAAQKLPMIYRVPTNLHVQTIPRSAVNTNYAMVSHNLPETMHPIQMNLIGSGFKGHAILPAQSDQIWKFNRAGQAIASPVWYKTGDSTWRLVSSGFPLCPTNYFAPDDGLVLVLHSGTTNITWTNRFTYSIPTRDMNP